MPPPPSLGAILKEARVKAGMSLRDIERRTGLGSGHLSQIETNTIRRPEMAILWDLAVIYDLDYTRLLALAGYGDRDQPSARQRQRMTVALRAMSELAPADQAEALRFMAALKTRRDG